MGANKTDRGKMARMARTRRNPTIPSVPTKSMDVVKTFRMPMEVAEAMDQARGLVPESVWLRDLVKDYLLNREQRDLCEIRDLMYRRGITLEQFINFMKQQS